MTIAAAALAVTTTSLSGGVVGTAYSAGLAASGGVPPYTWVVTGLPSGLSASTAGAIGGTPTATGTFSVGVTVTDHTGLTAPKNLALTIATAPLVITALALGGMVRHRRFRHPDGQRWRTAVHLVGERTAGGSHGVVQWGPQPATAHRAGTFRPRPPSPTAPEPALAAAFP